jgi:hypothetical protein
MAKETYDPHKGTTELRAGDKRQMNMRVLFISFIAVVILFAIIYFFLLPHESDTELRSPSKFERERRLPRA